MRARIVGLVGAAFMALWGVPAGALERAEVKPSLCIDIVLILSPSPTWSIGRPYSCACGPALTQRPISGGAVYTINTGCWQGAPTE